MTADVCAVLHNKTSRVTDNSIEYIFIKLLYKFMNNEIRVPLSKKKKKKRK